MITDPLTLGVTGHVNVFDIITYGPGAKTTRLSDPSAIGVGAYTFYGLTLTMSHDINKKTGRQRSLFRLDASSPAVNNSLATDSPVAPPSVYLVVDKPVTGLGPDVDTMVKEMLSRILGFLSQNATGAPDHTFATQTKVVEWLRGEP